MSRFNATKSNYSAGPQTINRAGGSAYKESPQLQLVSLLLSSFVQDQFYRSATGQLVELANLAEGMKDKRFLGKAAIYARKEFGMRSITHALAAEIARLVKGETWTGNFFTQIVDRPDDMLEIVSYYLKLYGNKHTTDKGRTVSRPLPNAMKRGFRNKLSLSKGEGGFDEYQLAKYRKDNAEFSMIDLINLLHPQSNKAINKLMRGQLRTTGQTWESTVSAAGTAENVEEAKTQAWGDLLSRGRLGYMALIKNLRNISQTKDDNVIKMAAEALVDENKILKSRVFPFRLQTAYDELRKANANRRLIDGLHDAVDISLGNIPNLPGKTLVALDTSGSMTWHKGDDNKTPLRIGSLFASALYKQLNADIIHFSHNAEYLNPTTRQSVLQMANWIEDKAYAGGTNFSAIFDKADKAYDRIIILSDMQSWIGNTEQAFKSYSKKYNVNPSLYCFDLQGYGDLQFPQSKVYTMSGFSEKILNIMEVLEQDKQALVHLIEKVEL